jgi:site-specific DNA recombinase
VAADDPRVIEQAVLSGLRSELRAPAVLAEYVKAYHEERARLAANSTAQRSTLRRRIDEIVRETQRLVDAIAKGHGDPGSMPSLARKPTLTVGAERW